MSNERVILCGTAAGPAWVSSSARTVPLRLWGKQPNVFVAIEDLTEALWATVPDVFLDLLDVATYVYCADQAVSRGSDKDENFGARWRRRLHFAIPVRRPEVWTRAVQEALVGTLSFLSEDEYHFHFEPLASPPELGRYLKFPPDRFGGVIEEVLLFSGGLDSLAGAVEQAVLHRRPVALVHQRSNPKIDPVHQRLMAQLTAAARAVPPQYVRVRINKERGLSQENSQRSRSFLFAALGAAVAAVLRLYRFCFYENGVTSLNLPPSAQVVGARASRTTHPAVLRGFAGLCSQLAERPFYVENPFLWKTKTEVIQRLAAAGCGGLIAHSRSCANPRQASTQQPHCGLCSQCIDRRFAVLAAGAHDHDPASDYRIDLLSGPRPEGHAQTMLAVYVEMARQISRMTAAQFFRRFGEASRVLGAFEDSPEVIAQKVFELYQRHARQVNGVVQQGLAGHTEELFQRTLPASCLLRMVCEGGGSEALRPAAPAAPAPLGPYVFRRWGEAWQVRFAGQREFMLLPSTGAAYLHLLLQRPGVPAKAVELAFSVAKEPKRFALGDAGAILDDEGLTSFRAQVEDLEEELREARDNHDLAAQQRLQNELRWVVEAIEKAQGRGGRRRKAGDNRERVRKAVGNALRRAVQKIRGYDQLLGNHLRPPHLCCGNQVCYRPPAGITWET
jgi:Queuosine biosynthesis protein QueC